MGFIIVAKGRQGIIIFCELAWALVHLGLAWICIGRFGLNGAGIAFFGSYVFHIFLTYAFVRRLSDFRWSPANFQLSLFYLAALGVVFCGFFLLPFGWATFFGTVVALVSALYSGRTLLKLFPTTRIPSGLRPLFSLLQM
jgi:antigen flippase